MGVIGHNSFHTNPLSTMRSFHTDKLEDSAAGNYFSNKQPSVEVRSKQVNKPVTKVKSYQASTISMSRKSSVKSIESVKDKSRFQSFLKQPTKVSINRNSKLRFARSNDTHNSSRASEKSTNRHVFRRRRKQPSVSIESTRQAPSRYGSTLRLFSN